MKNISERERGAIVIREVGLQFSKKHVYMAACSHECMFIYNISLQLL